jgi:predicted nucleic-acid-binding Zn-ribbon protein
MTDITRPAPRCPECGGARFWYGSVEFWVTGTTHSRDDHLNVAVCSNCGYSSVYLQNMPKFRQDLTKMGFSPPVEERPGTAGINQVAATPQERPEIRAIREALLLGDKMKAIKLYRSLYGGSMKEAQDALDAM